MTNVESKTNLCHGYSK